MRSEDEIKREIEIIKIAKDVNKNGLPDLLHAIALKVCEAQQEILEWVLQEDNQ